MHVLLLLLLFIFTWRTLEISLGLMLKAVVRLRTRWLDYIKDLGWNHLGLRPSEIQSVLVDREVLLLQLSRKSM